ncbi:hypothetical protein [Pedobacter sp.]|uniref:hypothetical protein n=1 Tax=Pedobacter sp. TaxID=1411316 RepID=UPI0031DAA296
MKDTIGKIIKDLLNKEGAPTKEDFSQMMSISYKTLYNVMNGNSNLTFDQVVKASEILQFDIGAEYYSRTNRNPVKKYEEPESIYTGSRNQITVTLTLMGSASTYENFPQLLNKVRSEAKELGFNMV